MTWYNEVNENIFMLSYGYNEVNENIFILSYGIGLTVANWWWQGI